MRENSVEFSRIYSNKSAEVESVTYPDETTARYTVTIPKDSLVGKEINEAALVDSDGDLVAIKNMYSKKKDEGVSFTFEFDDEF